MSLIIVHTRWAAGSAEHLERLTALLPGDLPEGCCSRQLRGQGAALFGTEIWTDDGTLQTHRSLADVLDLAGLGRPTHTAIFAVPDPFAWAYLRAGRHPGDAPGRLHGEPDPFLAGTASAEGHRCSRDEERAAVAGLPRQRSDRMARAAVAR